MNKWGIKQRGLTSARARELGWLLFPKTRALYGILFPARAVLARCFEFGLAAVIIALIGASTLRAQEQPRAHFREIVTEAFDPSIRVAGTIPPVGLAMADADGQPRNYKDIWVALPPAPGSIRLVINTVDGRYNATLLFDVAGGVSHWEHLEMASKDAARRDSILKDYSATQVAYAIEFHPNNGHEEPKTTGTAKDRWLLVAADDPSHNSDASGAVLVNSLGAQLVYYRLSGNKTPVRCTPITDRPTKIFDTVCRFPLDKILQVKRDADQAVPAMTIGRVRDAEPLEPLQVFLQ
jgi:hypothetical protein